MPPQALSPVENRPLGWRLIWRHGDRFKPPFSPLLVSLFLLAVLTFVQEPPSLDLLSLPLRPFWLDASEWALRPDENVPLLIFAARCFPSTCCFESLLSATFGPLIITSILLFFRYSDVVPLAVPGRGRFSLLFFSPLLCRRN